MEVSNVRPIAILAAYLSLSTLLTCSILRTLYRMSNHSRARQANARHQPLRSRQLLIFAGLAVICLGITWFYMLSFFTFSYQEWAHKEDVVLPTGLWGPGGVFGGGKDKVRLHLGPWLRDTKLFREAWETVLDGSIRFWWSQHIFLITMAWSVYLGIEGNRCKIPHLWAFMLLGQIVAISFAMNLSFVAMLLSEPDALEGVTSSNIGSYTTNMARKSAAMIESEPFAKQDSVQERDKRQGNHSDIPPKAQLMALAPTLTVRIPSMFNRISYAGSLFLTSISVLLIPFSVHTPLFMYLLAVPHVILFLPIVLPSTWEQTKLRTGFNDWTSIPAYRLVTHLSIVLYVKATISALLDGRSEVVERVLQELYSHPAVSSVGWDVILCCISAFLWMSFHGPDSWMMLRNSLILTLQKNEPRLAATAPSKTE
ncbi:hypothetical protein N7G274_000655 [Stereocaulon virgatum]|uniref:Alpha-1,3-glucosyltransferase n=1 Tax=Stereocaulon virgatum TaxID=373712 RepID=A0ABR4AR38_9LECA